MRCRLDPLKTSPMYPAEILPKLFGNGPMVPASPITTSVRPRKINMLASVTMNAGIFW